MNTRFMNCVLTCLAAASLMLVAPEQSNASLIVEDYGQGVFQWGINPSDVSGNFSAAPGSLTTSSASGYVSILNSTASSTAIDLNYSLVLGPISTYGYAFAFQYATFHVDAATNFSFSMSSYTIDGSLGYNIGQLIDITNGVTLFDDFSLDGTGSSHDGLLQPDVQYSYFFGVQPVFCPTDGSPIQVAINGQASLITSPLSLPGASPQSAVVPEPSSVALAGFGALAMAFYGYRRRRTLMGI